MGIRQKELLLLPVGAVAFAVSVVCAQSYPSKPIRVVTAQVGGSQDFGVRLLAPALSASLGQQVVVENRSGGTIGGEIVAKANPDGYTLIYSGTIFWTLPLMRKSLPYDVLRDYAPVTMATRAPLIFVVHPAVPVKSVKDVISLAKTKPGGLNYATGGSGSSNHLAAELFKFMAGVDIITVQYRGSGGGVIGLMGGEVQMMIASTGSVSAHVKSGKVRALAVTTAEPTPLLPGLPTVAASGVPGYESTQKAGMFAPAKTPAAVISKLNRELVLILNRPDIKEKFVSDGVDTVGSTPAELAAMVKAEVARMEKVIKAAGITAE